MKMEKGENKGFFNPVLQHTAYYYIKSTFHKHRSHDIVEDLGDRNQKLPRLIIPALG